jgi:hypothetical protein
MKKHLFTVAYPLSVSVNALDRRGHRMGARSIEPGEGHLKSRKQDGNYNVVRWFAKHGRKQQKKYKTYYRECTQREKRKVLG